MPNYKKIAWEINCGHHSNIPKCCTLFFISVWQPYVEKQIKKFGLKFYHKNPNNFVKKYHDFVYEHSPHGHYGYIACPKCLLLKRKPNKVKRCFCYHVLDETMNKHPNHNGSTIHEKLDWIDIISCIHE